jgi:demethylspheroidene O-methyltransferase
MTLSACAAPPQPAAAPTLRARLERWRDQLQMSPRFRSWAAANPFTRPIARKRARALFDLCAGFVYTQVLLACVKLRVFDLLAEGPLPVEIISLHTGLGRDATIRLLDAAVSLDLLDRRAGNTYGLGNLGCAMIGNAGITAMVEHHAALYADLHDPVALLKGQREGALSDYWKYVETASPSSLEANQTDRYTALMAASQSFIAEEVLAAYDFRRHRNLLDVGGGDGSFLSQVANQASDLQLQLLDLPSVAARAQRRFDSAGIAPRATAHGGDAIAGPLPTGADIVSFVRVLHDHDDAAVLSMLRNARAALPATGTLLIAEPMSGTSGAEPIGDAYFGFYFLAMGQGRSRTPEALEALLETAGFGSFRRIPTRIPMLVRILVASPAK